MRGKMNTEPSKDIDEREDRRYVDLAEMNYKHWKKNGAKGVSKRKKLPQNKQKFVSFFIFELLGHIRFF